MTQEATSSDDNKHRLVDIQLDPDSISRSANPNVDHERQVAIYDLIEQNSFVLEDHAGGPYKLILGTLNDRLVFNVHDEGGTQIVAHMFSFSPLKRIIRDYFIVCDSYYEAIKTAPPSRIQAIDMGRRGLHDDGSRALAERLKGKIAIDHDTARRLFTLICSLHWKG